MTDNWASMPLVDDSDPGDPDYGVRPKYRVDTDIVIHQRDNAYVPLTGDLDNPELLEYPDVHTLTDAEVEELDEQLPYPLPSLENHHTTGEEKPAGLGDIVATVTHTLGIAECAGCKKRRRWLNRIPVRWQRRK